MNKNTNQNMKVKQEVKELFVTLDMADGTTVNCKVMASFEVGAKTYAALLPMINEKDVDLQAPIMLYRMEEDETHNPIVVYIDDDAEYNAAAEKLSSLLS